MRHNLSEIVELIKDRRTIYPEHFSDRKVHKEQVELILNSAIWAPTHKLTQPWRFKVFMDEGRERLGEFLKEMYLTKVAKEKHVDLKIELQTLRPANASAVIAVCMERDEKERVPEIEEIQAVACAVQNMYLTCTAYGLGGFYSTPKFARTQEMNEFLGLGEKDHCLGFFYIGYPGEKWPRSRRKPIEYVTEWIHH